MTTTLTAPTRESVASELARARRRTLDLLAPITDADQRRAVSPLMSPLCWDLAHIGHYEELWLLRALVDAAPTDTRYDDLYDAFKHPRRDRPSLPILGPDDARAFIADVRVRVLDGLDTVEFATDDPLRADAFVYGMVIQHEHQHDETMLATIQLMGDDFVHPAAHPAARAAHPTAHHAAHPTGLAPVPSTPVDPEARCAVPGGIVTIGARDHPWAYDNERPAHTIELAPFVIDRYPVTNGRYTRFVADGGYHDPRHWSAAGWSWRTEAGLAHPQFWRDEGAGTWSRLRFGRRHRLDRHGVRGGMLGQQGLLALPRQRRDDEPGVRRQDRRQPRQAARRAH
jgi:iron(II)-dependent oxidoreductase